MIRYFTVGLILLLSLIGRSQTYTLEGQIVNQETNLPVQDSYIQSKSNSENWGISDKQGQFIIEVSDSVGQLHISTDGYRSVFVDYNTKLFPLKIRLTPDVQLFTEVKVIAYSGGKINKETAGGIAHLNEKQLKQGSGVSLQSALNTVPGVRMDQSTLSESRISIRGSGVQAPWGIRGIKVYVNDIPVTETDGTTRIEGLDVNDLGGAEIIKGPASSLYGGGTGGVINFQLLRAPKETQSVELSGLVGSFGLGRIAAIYRGGGEKFNSYVSYGHQTFDGYREHSHDVRDFFTGNFQFRPSENRELTVLISRTSQKTEIPGFLTSSQVEENPRQGNQANLDKKAARYHNWTRIGMAQNYQFNKKLSNSTSVYTYFNDLDHPLSYAYVRNFYQSFGGRTRFDYNGTFKIFPTRFTFGGEYNFANSKGTQYVNNGGVEGKLTGNTDYKNTVYSIFYQSETYVAKRTSVTLGMNLTGINYDIKEYLHPEQSGIKRFQPQFSPRVAISHTFGRYLSLHGGMSYGFNVPTGGEIKNVDGTINQQLNAEKGVNYELNAKGNLFNSRFGYDLALFHLDMTGEYIPQTVENGITVYQNAGKTVHNGVELAMSYQIFKESDEHQILSLRPFVSVTYSDFWFKDYRGVISSSENNFNRNLLPGISPWMVSTGINLNTKIGIYTDINYYFFDRYALNNANSAFNNSYSILNIKIGYESTFWKHLAVNIYAGIDNATNSHYSSFTALNAMGYGSEPAYFNPASPLNWYSGLSLKYIF